MTRTAGAHIAIVQHSIRRYRVAFYEALRTRLAATGVALRLLHSDVAENLTDHSHNAQLPWAEVRLGRRLELGGKSLLWQPVVRTTRDADLVIVEQASHLLANYVLLAGQPLGGPRVALWGHGGNFLLPDARRSMPEWVKSVASRRAAWWFAYNDRAADVVTELGYPRERITVVDNATDTRWLASQVDGISPQTVAAARQALGVTGSNVAVFLGTLGAVKRFEHLFAAADRIRGQVPDFELVIAGDGTEEPRVVEWTTRRSWAHYAGPRYGHDVVPLLAMAQLVLVPGWAGLVVVDSFAAGVPLVASASAPHPPEIAYLSDGLNGRLVDDGGDPLRYADAVIELLRDDERRQALVHGCVEARSRYSVEAMVERFTAGVLAALE